MAQRFSFQRAARKAGVTVLAFALGDCAQASSSACTPTMKAVTISRAAMA